MSSALMQNYGARTLEFERGDGSYLYTANGDRYLDFGMGIAVNSLGHCNKDLVKALAAQAEKLWHTSNLYEIAGAEALAGKLVEQCFAEQVFFCNSGTEAIECGYKAIRRYFHSVKQGHRKRIISLSGAFHGRSIAAISSAANPAHCEGFLAGDGGFDQAEFGNLASLRDLINDETAAIVLEPVQGEGGIKVCGKDFLKQVRDLCDSHDLLLMFDEVQCGVARTGSLYAHQQLGVEPDILASAKGLGGGFPIGACLTTKAVGDALTPGSHGSTFGGNPLAMAVGNAVIDKVSTPAFLSNVSDLGEYFKSQLQGLIERYPAQLKEVQGMGLMLGLYCSMDAGELIAALQQNRLLVVKAGGNCMRLLPALNVSKIEIDSALEILDKTLSVINN